MTSLLDDDTLCLGILPSAAGTTQACKRRDLCARYLQRGHGAQHTPVAQWLCPDLESYWEHYIEVQPA